MELTERQEKLLEFVKRQHGAQVRKYTAASYWTHLVSVARIASEFERHPLTREIALGHDLFEDTPCTDNELRSELVMIGYSSQEADAVIEGVKHLTDQFVPAVYPDLNRQARKEKERKRLSAIPPHVQSIKYADMIDNVSSIVEYDPGFGIKYVQEKILLLDVMRKGNIYLLVKCAWVLQNSLNKLDALEEL